MSFDAALVKEQGVTFAVVVVKPHVLDSSYREETRNSFKRYFPGVPIVLMCQNARGIPTYHGRNDIVKFLASVPFQAIPWKRYQS